MERHEEYFKAAKDQYRLKGVGGIQLPNPDLTPNPVDPIKTDPNRQIILHNEWVMVGGKTIRPLNRKSPVQILGVSSRIIDQRKKDATKKDQKSNDTNSQ